MAGYFGQKIECPTTFREAYICYGEHRVGDIVQEINDAGEVGWNIHVYYDNWEKAGSPPIPGIDADAHLDEYPRTDLPYIIYERTLPECRTDLPDYLKRFGMKYYDRFEFAIRVGKHCGPSRFWLERKGDWCYDR